MMAQEVNKTIPADVQRVLVAIVCICVHKYIYMNLHTHIYKFIMTQEANNAIPTACIECWSPSCMYLYIHTYKKCVNTYKNIYIYIYT